MSQVTPWVEAVYDFRLSRASELLDLLIQDKKTTHYEEFAPQLGLHWRDGEFHNVLTELARRDYNRIKPIRVSIVTQKNPKRKDLPRIPGKGYFETLKTLFGRPDLTYPQGLAMWEDQLRELGVAVH